MARFEITPSKTALLTIDLQNLFVKGYEPISAPDGPRIVERMNRLAAACRRRGILVIYTTHKVRRDMSNLGVFGEIIPQPKFISEDDEATDLYPGVDIQAGDVFLKKARFGAFTGTDLDLILRGKGIDTVIIGGIATNVCCETTARQANHLEYRVIFLSDGTASRGYPDMGFGAMTPEDVQRATCTVIGSYFGEVARVDEVIERIEQVP